MTDQFEDQLKRWLRERAATDRSTLQALAGNVAVLPPRRRRGRSNLAAAGLVLLVIGLGAYLLGPRLASIANQVLGVVPPNPAAFAGDPRLQQCASEMIGVDRVFEMTKARYFPLHFPGWWRGAPELEVDEPALVVLEPEHEVAHFGGPSRSFDPNANRGYAMCIAVGPPNAVIVHRYGPTRFDRIVPVLSEADLARALRMDPDVLADPANFPAPERLAPCGGDFQYVFEANPARDFPRYFPAALSAPEMNVDDVAVIVVYRGRNPMPFPGPSGFGTPPPLGPNEHDICVVMETGPNAGQAFFYGAVDITGFHVRLDEPAPAETSVPGPTGPAPSTTPEPAPAWVSDLAAQLDCDGAVANLGGEFPTLGDRPESLGDDPTTALAVFLGPKSAACKQDQIRRSGGGPPALGRRSPRPGMVTA